MRTTTGIFTLFTIVALTLLSGCASRYVVQVSAIADADFDAATTRYVLRNGNIKNGEDDLFFREYSRYFIPILAEKGYQQVDSREQADLEIFLRYTVSKGSTGISTFTHPVYETIGGNTINIVETKTDGSGGTTTTRSTVHIPPQTVYVGTAVESHSYTLYTSNVALEAYSLKSAEKILWKTLISCTDESNDLRALMPVLATAAAPYLAANSGAAKTIQLRPDDPRISAIKKQAGVPAAN